MVETVVVMKVVTMVLMVVVLMGVMMVVMIVVVMVMVVVMVVMLVGMVVMMVVVLVLVLVLTTTAHIVTSPFSRASSMPLAQLSLHSSCGVLLSSRPRCAMKHPYPSVSSLNSDMPSSRGASPCLSVPKRKSCNFKKAGVALQVSTHPPLFGDAGHSSQ